MSINVVRTIEGEAATLYEPDPLYIRFRTLRRLIEEHDHRELLELKDGLQRRIEELETQHEVDLPTALREQAADAETAEATRDLAEDASDWELSLYQLSVVNEAIDNYEQYAELDQGVQP